MALFFDEKYEDVELQGQNRETFHLMLQWRSPMSKEQVPVGRFLYQKEQSSSL